MTTAMAAKQTQDLRKPGGGFDFSKLKRPHEMEWTDPMDRDDRDLFSGAQIHRGVLDILARAPRMAPCGDMRLPARAEDGRDVDILFTGQRSDIFLEGAIRAHLDDLARAHDDAGKPEDGTLTRMIVEGTWRRTGGRLTFLVARWQINTGTASEPVFLEEGRLPAA